MAIDITLTFGKHNGKKLSQVPTDYLRWLSEQATICGKKDIPQAAKSFLSTLPNATRYNAPKTAEQAEKLAWMASMGNKEAARTLLAARNKDGYILVDFEDADGEEGFFEVYDNGCGRFVGSQANIDEAKREAEEDAKAEAERNAHPDLEWVSPQAGTIKVWHEFWDGESQAVTVLVKGQKVDGMVFDEIPAKQRAFAKQNGIVAVISTRLGDIGLTAERKAVLDGLKRR